MGAVLPGCLRNGTRIVSNMGAANPPRAARLVAAREGERPRRRELRGRTRRRRRGDRAQAAGLPIMETGEPLEALLPRMASANAYLGADVVCRALDTGAQIVITGRVADPSLFLAPRCTTIAGATTTGRGLRRARPRAPARMLRHSQRRLLRRSGPQGCARPRAARISVRRCRPDGRFWISKLEDAAAASTSRRARSSSSTRSTIPRRTSRRIASSISRTSSCCRPARTACRSRGARARPRTATYKVTVGYHDGYIGEGQISYAGINAVAKAKLAAEVVQQRLKDRGLTYSEVRVDLIGMSSVHGMGEGRSEPYEVRMRLAMRTTTSKAAEQVGFEVRALHVNGPEAVAEASDPSRARCSRCSRSCCRASWSTAGQGGGALMPRVYDLATAAPATRATRPTSRSSPTTSGLEGSARAAHGSARDAGVSRTSLRAR
jgi:hypothetical protein